MHQNERKSFDDFWRPQSSFQELRFPVSSTEKSGANYQHFLKAN
jgi:hypothetical protein